MAPAYYGSLVFAILLISLICFRFPRATINPQTDPSWNGVLVYAHEKGLQFGRDIVFTYGPLGFLSVECFSPSAGVTRLFSETLMTLLIVSGFCVLAWRIKIGWRIALLIFFVVVTAPLHWGSDLLFDTGLFSWGLVCFLETGPRLKVFVPLLIILAAVEALTKFNLLVLATLTIGWLAIDLCWRGKWTLAFSAVAGYVAAFVLGWILLGQNLAWIGAFVRNAFAIATGYNETMAVQEISWPWLLAVTLAALLAAFIRVVTSRNTATNFPFVRNAWLMLWLLGIFFVVWKYAVVRADYYHAILPLGFLPVFALALESLPVSHPRAMLFSRFGALVCLGLAIVLLTNLNNSASAGSYVIDRARRTFRYTHENAEILWRPKDYLEAQNKSFRGEQRTDLLPKTRSIVQHATVDVFGSDQALALLNALNYQPRPVFQSYSAYTRHLMELNGRHYTSPEAPEFVLFNLAAIDGRFPPLEDAFTLRELLASYSLAGDEKGLLLLRKKSNVTPVQMTLIREGDVQLREKISLTEFSGTNLWIEFTPRLNTRGRFRQFIFQPPALQLRLWNSATNFTNYAAPAPMLAAGFLVSPVVLDTDNVRQLYTSGSSQRPVACAVDTADASLDYFEPQIHFWLYQIENPLAQAADRKIAEGHVAPP